MVNLFPQLLIAQVNLTFDFTQDIFSWFSRCLGTREIGVNFRCKWLLVNDTQQRAGPKQGIGVNTCHNHDLYGEFTTHLQSARFNGNNCCERCANFFSQGLLGEVTAFSQQLEMFVRLSVWSIRGWHDPAYTYIEIFARKRMCSLAVIFHEGIGYSQMKKLVVTTPKYGLRPPEVAAAFGSRVLLEESVRLGLLKPVIDRPKMTVYDSGDVAQCWAKIIAGELDVLKQKEAAAA